MEDDISQFSVSETVSSPEEVKRSAVEIIPRPDDSEIREMQERTLSILEKKGYVSVERSESNQVSVVKIPDLDLITKGYTNNEGVFIKRHTYLKQPIKSQYKAKFSSISTQAALYLTFKGIPVLADNDCNNSEAVPRNLYYVPSKEEVFDVESIKRRKHDHYSSYWNGSGKGKDWSAAHPTVEDDFNSNISILDVAVPYEIYATANGARNEDGILFVDKIPGLPEEGRTKISGQWFKNNFFGGGSRGETPTMDEPRLFIRTNGSNWERNGLLLEDDFQLHNSQIERRRVAENGTVSIGSRRYTLGRQYEGSDVLNITGDKYVILVKGEARLVFSTLVDKEDLRNCSTTYNLKERRTFTLVPTGSFETYDTAHIGSYSVHRYDGEKIKKFKINAGDHIQALVDFRGNSTSEVVNAFSSLSVNEQTSAMLLLKELEEKGDSRASALLKNAPEAAKLFADSYMNGSLDSRVLGITEFSVEEQRSLTIEYANFRRATDDFVNSFSEIMTGVSTPTDEILLERIREAFAYRAQDFLVIASEIGIDKSLTYIKAYSEAIESAILVLKGKSVLNINESPGRTDKGVVSISSSYKLHNESVVTFTVRPDEIKEEFEKGQSRVGLSTKNSKGDRVSIRLDCDEHGISLDLGSKDSDFVEQLNKLGISHHTQAPFENGISNAEVFRRFALKLPKALGWINKF